MEKVIAAYKEIERCELRIKALRQKISESRAMLTEAFIPILMKAYDKWQPKIGEPMMLVDFLENISFKVTLESLDGKKGRAKENDRNFHRFDLEPNLGEYNTATFVIPMFLYKEIEKKFKLRRWDD